jgi:hypothetical protein
MNSYVKMLMDYDDNQLAEQLASPMPGSQNHELIKFEMQRSAMIAQKAAAEATVRGAIAAERYTKATWVLIAVTVIGVLASLCKS